MIPANSPSQTTAALLRSRLCWRVTLYVFVSILAVEAMILWPSYQNFKDQALAALADSHLAALRAVLAGHDHHSIDELLQRAGDLRQGSDLRGGALFDAQGGLIGTFGERPEIAPEAAEQDGVAALWHREVDRYDVLWPSRHSGLPFQLAARLDSAPIETELRAFVLRIGGLILIVSAFVCAATILVVGRLVLRPMLDTRARLVAAEGDPVNAVKYVAPTGRNDEMGELRQAMNTLLARLSATRLEERREGEKRLHDFANASSDWFWEMDENLRFSYFSRRFTEITGVPQEKLLGKTREETGIPNVDEESWRKHLADLAAHRPFRNFIHPRTKDDGETVWLGINGRPVFGEDGAFQGYRGTGSDVTEWYLAEQGLRVAKEEAEQARTQLIEAIEAMSEGFALFDAEERLVLCNTRYREMFQPASFAIRPDASFESIAREAAASGVVLGAVGREEHWIAERLEDFRALNSGIERRLSNDRWLRSNEYRTKAGGTVSIRTDITELKDREQRWRDAMNKAEQANRAKSVFLANMSHELRTPLNAIIGFSEMIANEQLGPAGVSRYAEYAGDICNSGRHLLGIINEILDISKIEAGKIQLSEDIVDLGEVIGSCVTVVSNLAAERGISLRYDAPEALPEVRGDMVKLRQILLNLVSNAIKFTPSGGAVTVRAGGDAQRGLQVTISDSGIGMTGEQIEIALTPFGQVDSELSRKFDGVGLGLPLTKAMVELHGGSLEVVSEVGVGTTVTIDLPPERIAARKDRRREASA